ncbi:hypothetical protein DDE18_03880 [Nocardioides gansuensis]|uniref:Uncharacterized protein n=1 Tax=Nocardioides gansuensis TaxID=2138300 RepID=A0A2T8FGC9_9ACTN|nr:DUF6350 family protein [Nocardioides gansuensis]PVG84747.1 hypothetical protein DDE18_03880 [Nocardioides gansuensis]
MTSLLAPRDHRTDATLAQRRPLVLVATLGGILAALGPLLVLVAVGIVGWFLSDAGVHGAPRDGMRAGALAWLMAHGSGVSVAGASVTVVPLGLTAVCAWAIWRLGHRVGDAVSGHGPDADRIGDGERDWTVPSAVGLFFLGYVVTAIVVCSLAGGADAGPSVRGLVGWTVLLTLLVAAPAIAVGSGRAAIWATLVPPVVRLAATTAVTVLVAFLAAATVLFLIGLALGLGEAATMLSQLHLGVGESVLFLVVNAAFVPNAVLFGGAFLLGPGFVVGGGTLVSPSLVVLGPLPLLPLLAALPDPGTSPAWMAAVVAVPPLVAAVSVAWMQRRHPTPRWDHGAMRGCGAGILAGVALAVLSSLAGGSAGPGRMRFVGAVPADVLIHAITAFALGGLVAGLATTWWQRRRP